jgi:hypothetical protein
MTAYLLHGIVDEWAQGRQIYRNYVSRASLEAHLMGRASPYGAWNADDPDGDVLTIDDATRAGADACRLARRLGHEVIFFVNPFQVATGEPYYFSLLDAFLDARTVERATFTDEAFDLAAPGELRRFRKKARAILMARPASEAVAATREIAQLLGADGAELPAHAVPPSLDELCGLRDAGVRIESHGWSHVDIAALDDAAFIEHIVRARDWLRSELAVCSSLYAVPFGLCDIPPERRYLIEGAYFLADPSRPLGQLGPRCWNRRDLTDLLQGW